VQVNVHLLGLPLNLNCYIVLCIHIVHLYKIRRALVMSRPVLNWYTYTTLISWLRSFQVTPATCFLMIRGLCAVCRGFSNVFSRRAIDFHKRARLFDLNFFIRRWSNQFSQVVNLLGARPFNDAPGRTLYFLSYFYVYMDTGMMTVNYII